MGLITIVNTLDKDIQVKVSRGGGDGGYDNWYTLQANGGRDSWTRNGNQVISFIRSLEPGTLVENILGVVGATTTIK